ncbi:MAG: DUF4293 family protein [Flavobacteriaceae bacterium]|jgi:hypothetical protein|nr:DUF4293 family protein [Flavobacteriaceae bacterium]
MIQRIQTVYLFIVLLVLGVLPFIFPLFTMKDGKEFRFMNDLFYTTLFGLSTALTLISIMYFKKRNHQFVLNRLTIILNLILLGLFVYRSLNLSGETIQVSEKGIGMFLPIVAIVFLALANRAIKKDEDLVKSADRLR